MSRLPVGHTCPRKETCTSLSNAYFRRKQTAWHWSPDIRCFCNWAASLPSYTRDRSEGKGKIKYIETGTLSPSLFLWGWLSQSPLIHCFTFQVSVTWGHPWPENIKWKIPETSKLHILNCPPLYPVSSCCMSQLVNQDPSWLPEGGPHSQNFYCSALL